MKKLLVLLPLLLLVAITVMLDRNPPAAAGRQVSSPNHEGSSDANFARAFEQKSRDVQLEGEGVVAKILPDDTTGIRHQKFIVRLQSGQSLLFAHNIDISRRISAMKPGGRISFKGEYEWSPQGGVMHWTHRDPGGRHPGGWIKYDSQTYQ